MWLGTRLLEGCTVAEVTSSPSIIAALCPAQWMFAIIAGHRPSSESILVALLSAQSLSSRGQGEKGQRAKPGLLCDGWVAHPMGGLLSVEHSQVGWVKPQSQLVPSLQS